MLKKTLTMASILALTLMVFSTAHVAAKPGPRCVVRDSGCTAANVTFTLAPNPTPPIPVCNVTLYSLSATITCGIGIGAGTPVSGYVCPTTDQTLRISVNGQWHNFKPASGHNWQDVIDDCSSYLTYWVD